MRVYSRAKQSIVETLLFVQFGIFFGDISPSDDRRHGERYGEGDKKGDVEVRCEDIVPTARVFCVGVRLKVILEEQVYYNYLTEIS